MSTIYVIDTGALVSKWTDTKPGATFVTTPSIVSEVRNRLSRFRAETLSLLDRMDERSPTKDNLAIVESAAESTGDKTVLSQNDLELIALALTISSEGSDIVLVSTDFAVLNTASRIGLKIMDPNKKFEQEITWIMRCPACNYRSKTPTREIECPVCGTAMRRAPSSRRRC
ncbi:MAG: NOB1 family endonuclease [Promethearchaeota archaeon]